MNPRITDPAGLQCATLPVAVDWARPLGPTIDLALARRPATDPGARIGSLLINPGGPGGSGVAAEQDRFGDAARLLDDAAALLPKIDEPEDVQRLQAQLEAVRALLPPGPVPTEPGVSPAAPASGSPRPPAAPSPMLPAPAVESGPGPGVVPPAQAPAPTGTSSVLVPLPPVLPELVPEIGPVR